MSRFTRWILAHRWWVVGTWTLITIISLVSIPSATNALSSGFAFPGKDGYETNAFIMHAYGNGAKNPVAVPMVTVPDGKTIDAPDAKAQFGQALAQLQKVSPGSRIVSYLSTGDRMFVSADGRTTFALVFETFDPATLDTDGTEQGIKDALAGMTVLGAPIHLTGLDVLAHSAQTATTSTGPNALVETLIGGVGALIVLGFVFTSFLTFVPLLIAIVSIATTFLLVWGVTAVTPVSFIVQYVVALIGLGIAIDYSLLIIMRWREERGKGIENAQAIERAMTTAGTSVIFSGTTVAVGLLALVVLPVPALSSIGYGGLLIPLVSVVVALTLLPVVLLTLGPRLEWPRRIRPQTNRLWTAWGKITVHYRVTSVALATVFMALLFLPAFSLNLGNPQAASLASSGDAYDGLQELVHAGFSPGIFTPFEIVVKGPDPNTVATRLAKVNGVLGATAPTDTNWHKANTALVVVVPNTNGTTPAGLKVTDTLRQVVKADYPMGAVRIGGTLPNNADFISSIYDSSPLMLTLIVVVTFLLLVRAFRSILLPAKAVLLVLVSVGAALGFLTLVWQNGYGSQALWGISSTGSITPFIPVLLFAFLFGISMDYEVFIMARMRENYDRYGSTNRAVVHGVGSTGRLVTSGAVILFLAFISLSSGPDVDVKVFATGLAAGILVDATVVRMLLVPSLVSLLGGWNWWLPAVPARVLGVKASPYQAEKAWDMKSPSDSLDDGSLLHSESEAAVTASSVT